jgi:copper oxidase (laccase) domain-containing protein
MDKQIYYHFLRYEDAKDDLKNERIKVSTIDTLNDPHEFMPYRRYRDREKRKLYDKVFKAVSEK